jgi:hypothetical protein
MREFAGKPRESRMSGLVPSYPDPNRRIFGSCDLGGVSEEPPLVISGTRACKRREALESGTLHSGNEFRNCETPCNMGASANGYSSSLLFRFVAMRTDAASDESVEDLRSGRMRSGRSGLHPHRQ